MSIQQTFERLKALKIQGATAVARAIILELKVQGLKSEVKNYRHWLRELHQKAGFLLSARPTEPMAQNLSRLLIATLQGVDNLAAGKKLLRETVDNMLDFVSLGEDNIIKYGQAVIKKGDRVLTHCHSSTVEKILVGANQAGKKIKVFNTETRPLYQGRITSANLLKQGLDVTMVADSGAGFLISPHSGPELMMEKVLIGADAIFSNGSAINKVGSFEIALTAHTFGVPVYIVAHLLKTDDDGKIEIEKRPAKEIWDQAPKGLEIINFAFDLIPAKYIAGFITEFGIIKPAKIRKVVKRKYPWLLR